MGFQLGGALSGQEQSFIDAANKYGIDPNLLMAISAFETGNGTSKMVQDKNNVAGIYDSKAGAYRSFDSIQDSIDFTAKNLKKNYFDQGLTTIPQIAQKYAPPGASNDPNQTNAEWPTGVSTYYNQIAGTSYAGSPSRGSIISPTSGGTYALGGVGDTSGVYAYGGPSDLYSSQHRAAAAAPALYGTGSNVGQMSTGADYAAAQQRGTQIAAAGSAIGSSLSQLGQQQARQGQIGMQQAMEMLQKRRSMMEQYLPPISGGFYG